jgi:AcrR family transcriptional regulator
MAKDGARERILATAARLFFERGYSEVGINEIIDASGSAKATFYHHFPSKQSLCQAWLAGLHDRWEARRREILQAPGNPVEKVAGCFDQLADLLRSSNFRGCPYTNTAAVVSEEQSCLCRAVEHHKTSMREFFRELASQVEPSSGPARSRFVGDTLFVLYSGATTEAQNLRSDWPVEVARQAAVEFCLCQGH